jgi:hypothetical protein
MENMQVAVFDTYVTKKDGTVMHFDIIVPAGIDESDVYKFGDIYLKRKGQEGQVLSAKQCQFCHVEHLQSFMEKDIEMNGFYILEMKGC